MRKLFLILVALLPAWAIATTTSGPTSRNILIDGNVTIGATNGTNGTDWELDEVFQGFQSLGGSVDWYVTWDDQNLYVGRLYGNNLQGSVIYAQAGFNGSMNSPVGFNNFDGLSPNFIPMGGVNFVAYLKNGYDEFRTYGGLGWSLMGNTSLVPSFSSQANGDHMEIAIPWNAITQSNGRPSNLRLVMYQVEDFSGACGGLEELVCGESPWGTGVGTNGPSIGVNDGIPFSAPQPGGCGVGQDTATRWWGCYPVIGGVGSNGWTAVAPNAGPDTMICASATSYFMQGNAPAADALGTWSIAFQPSGANALPVDPNNPTTLVQGLTELGTYAFVWDINYGGCPSTGDTVYITRVEAPPAANGGPDQTLTCDVFTAVLSGNAFGNYGGAWTALSGTGSVVSPNSLVTTVTNLNQGQSTYLFTINGGPACPSAFDTVTITTFATPFADAGQDQFLCNSSLTTLSAIDPTASHATATGQWTQFSGISSVIFTDNTSPTSNLSNLNSGDYQLIWTVSNGNCPQAKDTVMLRVYAPPIADAGPDLSFCNTDPLLMDANNPSGLGPEAYGFWTQLSGPNTAIIADSTQYNTMVSGLAVGTYKFQWTLGNGNCPVSIDVATLIITTLTDEGIDALQRPVTGQANGSVEIGTPLNGTPPYLFSLDSGPFQTDSTFSNLGAGTYQATIKDNNGCTATLQFILLDSTPPPLPEPDTLFIPDGFSPNGDGVNDTWEILGISKFPNAQIEIYNIWGALVFSSTGSYSPWNGQYQGQDMPQANFYYIVNLMSPAHPVYKGSVTLFR